MIKAALYIRPGHPYFTGEYFSPQSYRFFRALEHSADIDVKRFDDIDAIKNYAPEIIILQGLKLYRDISAEDARKLGNMQTPKIACSYDAHSIPADNIVETAKIAGCGNFFYHHPKTYFYRYAPMEWNYCQVIMCIDETLIENILPWKYRQSDKVLLFGACHDDRLYRLRRMCLELPCVKYVERVPQFEADRCQFLLQGFRASIAACDYYTVNKYFESMACGTLTFAQANGVNGWEKIGIADGVNCVFINSQTYKDRIDEYLRDKENPKWERIAMTGRKHVLENYTAKKQAKKLVNFIKEVL